MRVDRRERLGVVFSIETDIPKPDVAGGARGPALNLRVISVAICTGVRADHPGTQSSAAIAKSSRNRRSSTKSLKILYFSVMEMVALGEPI